MPTPLRESRFSETAALFASPTVRHLTEQYFAGQDFDFDLFVQSTDHTEVPASGALHWNKQLALKSSLYVTEATEQHGPMRAGVGTASWTRYIREDAMSDGVPCRDIVNQVAEKDCPVVHTGGPAGTFFLFVTDTRPRCDLRGTGKAAQHHPVAVPAAPRAPVAVLGRQAVKTPVSGTAAQ